MTSHYYRPTPGETPGHWNVFPRIGPTRHDVPFSDLPPEVQDMIEDAAFMRDHFVFIRVSSVK